MRCRDCAGERLGVGNGLCSRCEGSGLDPDPLQGWPHGDPSCIRCGGKKKCRTCRGRGYFTTLESHGYSNSAGDEITEDEDSGSFSGAPRTQIEDAPTGGDDEPIFRGAQPVRHPFLFYVVWVALSYGEFYDSNAAVGAVLWSGPADASHLGHLCPGCHRWNTAGCGGLHSLPSCRWCLDRKVSAYKTARSRSWP